MKNMLDREILKIIKAGDDKGIAVKDILARLDDHPKQTVIARCAVLRKNGVIRGTLPGMYSAVRENSLT